MIKPLNVDQPHFWRLNGIAEGYSENCGYFKQPAKPYNKALTSLNSNFGRIKQTVKEISNGTYRGY